jgi:hypothetical protein
MLTAFLFSPKDLFDDVNISCPRFDLTLKIDLA